MAFAPHFSTIVVGPLQRGVTAAKVARATGYKSRLIDIRSNQAWIEVANDGRTREHQDLATDQASEAGLLAQ
jgi:hypothetical protein